MCNLIGIGVIVLASTQAHATQGRAAGGAVKTRSAGTATDGDCVDPTKAKKATASVKANGMNLTQAGECALKIEKASLGQDVAGSPECQAANAALLNALDPKCTGIKGTSPAGYVKIAIYDTAVSSSVTPTGSNKNPKIKGSNWSCGFCPASYK